MATREHDLLEEQPIGGLRMAEVISQPTIIQHTPADVARAEAVTYSFVLQIAGSSLNVQDNRVAKLSAGDFALCTTARPYQMTFPVPVRRIVVAIPDAHLRRHLACADSVVAVRMHGDRGMNMLLGNFVQSFWSCRKEAVEPAVALRMSYTILDLIAAAYSSAPHARCEESSLVAAHRVRIIGYIEAHLRDPNLTPRSVAQACRITARYLHHLFAGESETVTEYIQRRRLEECARFGG